MTANPVPASHTQHSTQIWREAVRTASLNPRAIVAIKCWVLHMTEGAVWFVLLGQCEKLLAGIVSNVPSLIPAPGTCGLMPSDLPFSHVYRYLALRSLAMIVKASWHESGSFGIMLGRLDFLREWSQMRLINATVVATPHLVPGPASEGGKKGDQAGWSLGR